LSRRRTGYFFVTTAAELLGAWAHELVPSDEDRALARRALIDTVAVALAAREDPVARLIVGTPDVLGEGGRWAVAAHVLDFDDLHMESTTHVSAVCVPAVLATGGDERAYLAGAGVMARLGTALGWSHYAAGWHATCTAGAPAAAVAAGIAFGLTAEQLATAVTLAIPAAGGVQRVFGTDAKSIQVGFAVDAGIRAARLAQAGASADPTALDSWMELVSPGHVPLSFNPGPAVPGGLAIKIYPACYAMQRPINALAQVAGGLDPRDVNRIVLRTPESSVAPLIHERPQTGLEAKFSLQYAAATAILDSQPGFGSFSDGAVRRADARQLMEQVEIELDRGGSWLLDGDLEARVHLTDGTVLTATQTHPPGSPARPPSRDDLSAKVRLCLGDEEADFDAWTWQNARESLRAQF